MPASSKKTASAKSAYTLVDTHCHIHDHTYDFDPILTIARAHENSVDRMVTIGNEPKDSRDAKAFADEYPEAYWTFGYHPGVYHGEDFALVENIFKKLKKSSKLVAIGEIGLDYHYPHDRKLQIGLFEQMLQLAQDNRLPVVFHIREAFTDFWPIFDNFKLEPSVLHSFSDNQANLEQALSRNLYIGIGGLATFAPIPLPPLEKIILETDAPYLTPAPFRGKINEPSYIKYIAEWVAEKFGVSIEEVAQITTKNAENLYKL